MDGSKFPTKVEVRSGDLKNTESTKTYHILKRWLDTGQPGVISGLTLQATAGSNTRFDLLAGYGYAPNGELVELLATLSSQPAGTLTVGEPAIVGLMYRETETKDGAAETDGVARPRRSIRTSELKVFTALQWDAIPDTFDTDLSVDAKDRFLVCGIIALPVVSTNPLIITLPPTFQLIKTIPQPTNLTGVVITGLSVNTRNSDPFPFPGVADPAQVVFEPSTKRIAYASPFDAVSLGQAAPFNAAGVGVFQTIAASGNFTLVSANGLDTITIVVDIQLLPSTTAGASITDNLSVSTLYTKVADRSSAKDELHRHMLGGQIPTAINPHGERFSDIATLIEELIGTLKLGTRYTSTLAQAEVPKLVIPANSQIDATAAYRLQHLIELDGSTTFFAGGVPMKIRLYRTGADSLVVLLNAKFLNQGANGTFVRALANGDNVDAQSAMIELSPFAVVFYAHDAAAADTWDFTQWSRVQLFHSFSSDSTSLSGRLTLGTGLHDSAAERITFRAKTDYSWVSAADGRTLIWESAATPTPSAGATMRIYRVRESMPVFSDQFDTLEIVTNATWDTGSGGRWVKDFAGLASKVEIGRAYAIFTSRVAGGAAATFTDDFNGGAGWDVQPIVLNMQTGELTATAYNFAPIRTFTKNITGCAGMIPPGHEAFYSGAFGSAVDPEGSAEVFVKSPATALSRAIWPLELPNGAIVTASRVNFRSVTNPGGADYVRAAVVRSANGSDVAESLKTGTAYNVIANSAGFVESALTVDETALIRTVANATQSYYVWIAATAASGYEMKSVEIDYTLDEVILP